MGFRVTLDSKGLRTRRTTGADLIEQTTGTSTIAQLDRSPILTTNAKTAASTLTVGGYYTLSASAAFTTTMPLPSAVPGAQFIFRNISAHAHVLTGSQQIFATSSLGTVGFADATAAGTSLALPASVGATVGMTSNGLHFIPTFASGTLTIVAL